MSLKKRIEIPHNRHVLVSGMTRSGKSFLVEEWTKQYRFVVKLDTKREAFERKEQGKSAWRGLVENNDFVIIEHLEDLFECDFDKIIYAPHPDEMELEYYEEFFKWIYERGNTLCWCDELLSFTTATSYPRWYKNIMIMGASKGVALWNCTQRPMGIPSITTANSSYFFTFQLPLVQDRKKLVEVTGATNLLENPSRKKEDYNFWYFENGMSNAKLCRLEV